MKRYCVGKIYSQTEFSSEDTKSFMDINLDRLVKKQWVELSDQNEWLNSECIMDILFSDEYKLDIWNEIYLKLLAVSGEKEKLFPAKRIIYIGGNPNSNENQINCMKNTINNRKKKNNVYNDDLIFSMDGIKSVKKDVEIDKFGSDIIRLWLSEPEFRTLFVDTESRIEKYDPNTILRTVKNRIQNEESYIIVEKILGLDLGFYLQFCITEQSGKIEDDQLEKIIDSLIQCDGVNSRLLFLYDMRSHLEETKYQEGKNNIISSYLDCIQQSVPLIQTIYAAAIDAIMEQYVKIYSYETVLEIVKNKKDQYEKLVHFKYIHSEKLIFPMMQRCYKYFEDNEDKYGRKKMSLDMFGTMLIDFFCNNKTEKDNYLITDLKRYFENEMRWGSLKVDKYKNKIQSRIIQKSHKKYTEKAKGMP